MIKQHIISGVLLFLVSCVSMTPAQVNENLPALTKSKFLAQTKAEEAVKINKCRYLVKGREYAAPMGITVKGDLRNGAQGIDQWVKLDGGNTYVLNSYKWIAASDGSSQLHVVFDTMLCE